MDEKPKKQHYPNNMDTIPPAVAARQAQQDAEDDAGRRAAGKALPGPAAAAFDPQQNLKVGEYSVRPFCDADFETLQFLGNPLQEMVAIALSGESGDRETQTKKIIEQVSRGQHAWDICFVQTRQADAIDDLLRTEGVDGLKRAAKKAFGNKLPTMTIISIVMAVIDQMNRSWETKLGYGAPAKEGEGASGAQNP